MDKNKEIKALKDVLQHTLRLISLYKKSGLTVPFSLKGNLGEFIIAMELLERFPSHKVDYKGGAFPGVDISVDGIKVQVKTQIKHPPKMFRGGYFDFESSPTIKKATLDRKKCDILILAIIYPDESYSEIKNKHIYVFDQADFKYFSPELCWSGKSKGDYTICKVLEVKGDPPQKLKDKINFYNTLRYKKLFNESKDNWNKIKALLDSH
jgi:hypothetical protein